MKKVALVDVDGHKFPNLPLMKLSAHHKAQGDEVECCFPLKKYDIAYVSKVFANTPDIKFYPQAGEVIYGGTGYDLENKLPDEIEHTYPDYSLYPSQKAAYGFLTRGCPNTWCIVPEKEGRISHHVANLEEYWRGQKEIVLLDPNLLACADREILLEQLTAAGARVDFTQGLDARLVDEGIVKLLSQVKTKMVHFAWDKMKDEAAIIRGLTAYKKFTNCDSRKAAVYMLTNYDTTHEEDMYRVQKIREMGFMPDIRVYNKETAPRLTRWLQTWCNNRITYHAEPDFYRFRPGKTGKTVRQLMGKAEYAHLNLDRAALRAITPAGFAKAFFKANK